MSVRHAGAAPVVGPALEPFPLVTGTAYSSHAPASWYFNRIVLSAPMTCQNAYMQISLNASVPQATSLASTGTVAYSYSKGFTVFTRQGYGASSSNISYLTTASFGLSANVSYSSTSQVFAMSWNTDTTGGTTSFSTTSNAANWSSYATGAKVIAIPFVTSLSQGEYFFAHAHSSTSGTTNSNVTLLSVSQLHMVPQNITFGALGGSASLGNSGPMGFGDGLASAVTINNTMNATAITQNPLDIFYIAFSNA